MPRRLDPTQRAAELRALVVQVSTATHRVMRGRAKACDHPLAGSVKFVKDRYRLRHLGVDGVSSLSLNEALINWCRNATNVADRLETSVVLQAAERETQKKSVPTDQGGFTQT